MLLTSLWDSSREEVPIDEVGDIVFDLKLTARPKVAFL